MKIVSELRMIEAETVQERRVQIVDFHKFVH